MKIIKILSVAVAASLMLVVSFMSEAKASPRTDYLSEKLREARTIEIQSRGKYEASKARYHTAESYRRSLESEIKRVRTREAREYKAAQKAKEAEYMQVNPYLMSDMSAPTQIKWRLR